MSNQGRGQRCTYCDRIMEEMGSKGSLAATRDHTEPDCRGGTETVWACRLCNDLKADLSLSQWKHVMAKHLEWWRKEKREDVKLTIKTLRRFVVAINFEWGSAQ